MSEYHLKHFMEHIVHVVVLAQKHNNYVMTALNQLCIDSDYDGLITLSGFVKLLIALNILNQS